jgi:hypothetical protein
MQENYSSVLQALDELEADARERVFKTRIAETGIREAMYSLVAAITLLRTRLGDKLRNPTAANSPPAVQQSDGVVSQEATLSVLKD